jgi:hypothetical protein
MIVILAENEMELEEVVNRYFYKSTSKKDFK